MTDFLTQQEDGTSHYTLEDASGAILLEATGGDLATAFPRATQTVTATVGAS